MRALGPKAASRCETAKNKICRCRCGGKLHGALRMLPEKEGREQEFFEALPEEDPHHVRSAEEKRARRRKPPKPPPPPQPVQMTIWDAMEPS